jgi:hypothetical protein
MLMMHHHPDPADRNVPQVRPATNQDCQPYQCACGRHGDKIQAAIYMSYK